MKARVKFRTVIYSVSYLKGDAQTAKSSAQTVGEGEVELLHDEPPTGALVQIIDPLDPNRILTIASDAIEIFNEARGIWQRVKAWWQSVKKWWHDTFKKRP